MDSIDNFEIFDVISKELKKVIKLFYIFDGDKGHNVLFVTINDKVFGFGSNHYGVCGLGHQMQVNEPKLIEELCDKSVIKFYNGYNFVLALTNNNHVYIWGRNQFGQLGQKTVNQTKVYKPVLIEDLKDVKIKQISCGSKHTLVLTFDRTVYGWGDNRYGQIGCGKELGDKISGITHVKSLKKIEHVHCAFSKSFALTDNGMVYSWGWNPFCQIGHELQQKRYLDQPKLINNLIKINITSICSSKTNTYFLSSDGTIYFCGQYYDENTEEKFQLIPGTLSLPTFLKFLFLVKSIGITKLSVHSLQIFKENYSIAVLVINKMVYKLTNNTIEKTRCESLQEFYSKNYKMTFETINLSNETVEETIVESITQKYIEPNASISTEVLKSFPICNNSNLNNFSIKYIHIFDDKNGPNVLFASINDNVYGFGSNQFGVCGFGHNKSVKDPTKIPELCDKNIQQFFNGWDFVLGLTNDNTLYGWGSNNWYQLGRVTTSEENNKPIVIDIENKMIIQISCGSVHTLILTSDGMVYGWGRNRFGQIGCGKGMGDEIMVTSLTSLPKIKSIHCSFCQSYAVTDNGLVYSWGQNRHCDSGHDLEKKECVFEPKLIINLSNITSICSSINTRYFLTSDGSVYFCGKYYDQNQKGVYQKVPKLLTNELNIHSLHSINCYQKMSTIGCALSAENVYLLKFDTIEKTDYKNLEEFFSIECQLTYKTYYLKLISGIQMNNIKIKGKFIYDGGSRVYNIGL